MVYNWLALILLAWLESQHDQEMHLWNCAQKADYLCLMAHNCQKRKKKRKEKEKVDYLQVPAIRFIG